MELKEKVAFLVREGVTCIVCVPKRGAYNPDNLGNVIEVDLMAVIKDQQARINELEAILKDVGKMWGNDEDYALEMEYMQPVGIIWKRIKEALDAVRV